MTWYAEVRGGFDGALSFEELENLVMSLAPLPDELNPEPEPEAVGEVVGELTMRFTPTMGGADVMFTPVDVTPIDVTPADALAQWLTGASAALRPDVKAELNAERLLHDVLSEHQRRTYTSGGYFDVASGRRRFRVTRGTISNIIEYDRHDRPFQSWCVVPSDHPPLGDSLVAQKMILEASLETLDQVGIRNAFRPDPSSLEPAATHRWGT